MNSFTVTFLLFTALSVLLLPRRWAPLALLAGACYITHYQRIEIGPFHFTVLRLLIAFGLVRVSMRGERLSGELNGLDRVILVWAIWMLVSSYFHKDPTAEIITRLGFVYDALGIYFLLRIFCRSLEDVKNLCFLTAILLVPVAIEMIYEQLTFHNLFGLLGGGGEIPAIREGRIRAQGPFAHAILAGIVGAVCLPLMVGILKKQRKAAVAGFVACVIMIVASASSGPIFSGFIAIGGLFLWRYHDQVRMRFVLWVAIIAYIALDIYMKDPAYFLIARMDVVGGSTGWHRARLIQSAIEHLSEWWFAGTDYTRHWMATGVSWSLEHVDITNHYIGMGVTGGLPLMILFVLTIWWGFRYLGELLRFLDKDALEDKFFIWCISCSLFAHVVSCISVSYFDNSKFFLYLVLAMISSAQTTIQKRTEVKILFQKSGAIFDDY